MGRVAKHSSALFQGLQHQGNVALLQVTHTAMGQLGAAAGSSLGKVFLFQQQSSVAARGSVERGAKSSGSAADDKHVPRFTFANLPQCLLAIHLGIRAPCKACRAALWVKVSTLPMTGAFHGTPPGCETGSAVCIAGCRENPRRLPPLRR